MRPERLCWLRQEEDLGEYVCVAENEFGRRTRATSLVRKGTSVPSLLSLSLSLSLSSPAFAYALIAERESNDALRGVALCSVLCAADEVPFVLAICGGVGIVLVLMVLVLVLIACRKSRASALALNVILSAQSAHTCALTDSRRGPQREQLELLGRDGGQCRESARGERRRGVACAAAAGGLECAQHAGARAALAAGRVARGGDAGRSRGQRAGAAPAARPAAAASPSPVAAAPAAWARALLVSARVRRRGARARAHTTADRLDAVDAQLQALLVGARAVHSADAASASPPGTRADSHLRRLRAPSHSHNNSLARSYKHALLLATAGHVSDGATPLHSAFQRAPGGRLEGEVRLPLSLPTRRIRRTSTVRYGYVVCVQYALVVRLGPRRGDSARGRERRAPSLERLGLHVRRLGDWHSYARRLAATRVACVRRAAARRAASAPVPHRRALAGERRDEPQRRDAHAVLRLERNLRCRRLSALRMRLHGVRHV